MANALTFQEYNELQDKLREALLSSDTGKNRRASEALADYLKTVAREEALLPPMLKSEPASLFPGSAPLGFAFGVPIYLHDLAPANDIRATLAQRLRNMQGDVSQWALSVNKQEEFLTPDYTIRFVNDPQGTVKPVLYFRGKRVTTAWTLQLQHSAPADKFGASA